MYLPSGLQSAPLSLEPGLREMLRVTPAEAGTSNTSPRAVSATREPSGEGETPRMLRLRSFLSVRA